ncbi:MAG: PD-(D/E)XK nuclease family protein [Rhodospirillales bacterium]
MTAGAETTALRTTLEAFYETVRRRLDQFRQTERSEAPRFSIFEYIDPDENFLSSVIHDLLNPLGKHGQGSLFLQAFLEIIDFPLECVRHSVRVKREDPTLYCSSPARRIDITVEGDDWCIGIENKPFATEGRKQLKDYWIHLRRKYGEQYRLVYLSGDGSEPVSIGSDDLNELRAAGKFKKLAYPTDLHRWLRRCCDDCEAGKVRWFLLDFAAFVSRGFELAEDDTEPDDETR